ncbi:hypothetical protein [Agromyces sp. GXS1127]|uniref:hypothetical protein n=1 Tax=Agromyces sp. GXS1127 TaxID=3424181 RepID=UPI003D31BE96
MTEPAPEPRFDPRFDPRFQRGWQGRSTDAAGSPGDDAPTVGAAGPVPARGGPAPTAPTRSDAAWMTRPVEPTRPAQPAGRNAVSRPGPADADADAADADPDAAAGADPDARPGAEGEAERIVRIAFAIAWAVVGLALLAGLWAVWTIAGQDPFAPTRQDPDEAAQRAFAYLAGPSLLGTAVLGVVLLITVDGIRRAGRASTRSTRGGGAR